MVSSSSLADSLCRKKSQQLQPQSAHLRLLGEAHRAEARTRDQGPGGRG